MLLRPGAKRVSSDCAECSLLPFTMRGPRRAADKFFWRATVWASNRLYYAQTAQGLVFASELKSVQASGLVSREISAAGLVGYLCWAAYPIRLTIYRDMRALEPGHTLDHLAIENAAASTAHPNATGICRLIPSKRLTKKRSSRCALC